MSFTTVSDRDLNWLHDPRKKNNESRNIGPGTYDRPPVNEKTEVLKKRLEENRKKRNIAFGFNGNEREMSF